MTAPHLPQSVVLGLMLGLGLLLLLSSTAPRRSSPAAPARSRTDRIRRFLDEAGHHRLSISTVFIGSIGCAGVTFVLIVAITGALPVGVCIALFAALMPWGILRWQLSRRRKQLAEVWPDVVDHLRSAVRSGLALPEGLAELGSTGPEPLREPFTEFGADWRAGVPTGQALERLKVRLADPVGDRIVLALRTTRELGGTDLGRLLDTLADVLRENARTRSELEARQSWTVNGAKLAVAAPWIVVLLLSTRPEAAQAYHSLTGMIVLSSGLVVSLVCYHLMLRIGTLPAEERVLV